MEEQMSDERKRWKSRCQERLSAKPKEKNIEMLMIENVLMYLGFKGFCFY